MKIVDIDAFKNHFSSLIAEAEAGEDIIIAKAGKPVGRLIALEKAQRQPGLMKGLICMSDDFDAPLPPDLLEAFGATE